MLSYLLPILIGFVLIGYSVAKPYWREYKRDKIRHQPFKKEWRKAHYAAWSKFDSKQYQGVIDLIRKVSGDKPLWMIEEHWQGHQ